jgi:hypothetical protein
VPNRRPPSVKSAVVPRPLSRRLAALVTLLAVGALGACSIPEQPPAPGAAKTPSSPFGTAAVGGDSWRAAPVSRGGLSSLATADKNGFRVHTASGDKTFVPGMNLGSTTPTHQPGELAISRSDYRRWFAEMGEMGVRAVRIYTIHPPAFYDELASYNIKHPDAPLYLVQGVYLPDESYNLPSRTLYTPAIDKGFTAEIDAASRAVHGDLTRPKRPGFASGTWHSDVSRWLLSWIIGVEWDPAGARQTDRKAAGQPYTPGRYFRATPDATATERWIAEHMDHLAGLERAHAVSVPIAFANWPTTDPLRHPDEPLRTEDLVGVDAEHVLPTAAWPGGTFASFHAYPYYPDFLRHEKALQKTRWHGKPDAYAGYLRSLEAHFTTMPLLVTEFGVPSSLGSAHFGTDGRGQGGHTEQQAMTIDADLMRLIKAQGAGAGFVFSWADEWFKRTWNTMEHQAPAERRQLWHDPLTNEQWFGVVATDSQPVADAAKVITPSSGSVDKVAVDADASYLHLDITFKTEVPDQVTLTSDTVPGPQATDYRIDVSPAAHTAQAWVRAALDPIRLDTTVRDYQPDAGLPWHRYRMITNRALRLHGRALPAEFLDVGRLREGDWDPKDAAYDSLATWQVDDATLRIRVPWPMLGLSDPSSRTALGEGKPAVPVAIPGLGLGIDADGSTTPFEYTWPTWNSIGYDERVKQGADVLAAAFRETS